MKNYYGPNLFCGLNHIFLFKHSYFRYEMKMRAQEERMRALGLMEPTSAFALDEWEIPRDRVVINRKLGEGAFGTVYGGECFFDEKGWVSEIFQIKTAKNDKITVFVNVII